MTKKIVENRRGNLALMTALMAPAFVGVIGLSVETGYWYYLQDRAQNGADVAAYAATTAMRNHADDATAISDGKTEAAGLGFTASLATVVINIPPTSGANINPGSAEAIITYEAPRFFSSIFNNTVITHETRAVASYYTGSNACILALDPTAPGALSIKGTTGIAAAGCEMMSNSIALDSVVVAGSSETDIDCISSAGRVDEQGRRFRMNLLECNTYKTNLPALPDPYETVPEPNVAAEPCDPVPGGNSGTVDPGPDGIMRFCGGARFRGDWVFEPGVYIVDGGEMIADSQSNWYGEDVTFYFTNGANARWEGGAEINFTAPTTGDYAGLLLYADRGDTGAVHTLMGNAQMKLQGALYAAGSKILLAGTFDGVDTCLQLVSATIEITGTSGVNWTCPSANFSYFKAPDRVLLVE